MHVKILLYSSIHRILFFLQNDVNYGIHSNSLAKHRQFLLRSSFHAIQTLLEESKLTLLRYKL
jgi:hypothetical protein